MTPHRPRVVIIGAGFAGLWAARALADEPVSVLLIEQNNYHTFLPLLYQVAAAEIEPEEIAYPIRTLLRTQKNTDFLMAKTESIDWDLKQIRTAHETVPYDFLIVALGSTSNFFGVPGAEQHSFPLKTMEDANTLRNHILDCFEKATHENDTILRKSLLTFSIIGGGPTGLEFAGTLKELVDGPLKKDFACLDFNEVRVLLIEGTGSLLAGFPPKLQHYALKRLQKMGIEVHLKTKVKEISQGIIKIVDSPTIASRTIVWSTGVHGAHDASNWGLPVTTHGRVKVLSTLQVKDLPEVYVVGDLAYIESAAKPLPMIAPVAIQQGEAAASNVVRQIKGKNPKNFSYHDRGTMVTLGRNSAVASIDGFCFTGFIAWVLWVVIHLFNLIGFRNRVFVFINWAWDYIFFERNVRLIMPRIKEGSSSDSQHCNGQ